MRRVLTLLAAALALGVQAQALYRNVMPDGRVVYADHPIEGARSSTPVSSPPKPSAEQRDAARRRAEEDRRRQQGLDARLSARQKAAREAEARVAKAQRALEDAQTALEAGRTPEAGEMSGVRGGGARPNPAYFERLRILENAVDDARRELDEATRARGLAR